MSSRTITVFLAVLVLAAVPAWAAGGAEDYDAYLESLYRYTVPLVEPEQAQTEMQSDPKILVLDVRSVPERSVSYIDNSVLVDYDTFTIDEFLSLPRDTPIIAYCAVGFRAERVGEQLIEVGFTNVQNIYGGIIEWYNRGLPIVAGRVTLAQQGPENPPVHGNLPRWGKWVEDGNVTYEPSTK